MRAASSALPRWTPPPEHGARPRVVRKIITELRASLHRAGHELRARLRLVPRHNGDERQREMYQERLQACTLILECLLHYTDAVTLIVGRGEDGQHYGLRLDKLADLTGLNPRRVDRAMKDLRLAGFITSSTRAERTNTGYRGLTAVRQISIELFYALGMGTLITRARKKLYALRKARQRPQEIAHQRLGVIARDNQAKDAKRRESGTARALADFLPRYSPG